MRKRLLCAALLLCGPAFAQAGASVTGSLWLKNPGLQPDANAPTVASFRFGPDGAAQTFAVASQAAPTPFAIPALPPGRYDLSALFRVDTSSPDGSSGQLQLPRAPGALYAPLLPLSPAPAAPAKGVYADGSLLLGEGEAETLDVDGVLAFLDGSATVSACASQQDVLATELESAGEAAGPGAQFTDETGALLTSATGLAGASARTFANPATGLFRMVGLPGAWSELAWVFDLARDAAPDLLAERLRIDVQPAARQRYVLSAAAPAGTLRAFALGRARLKLHVAGAGGALLGFKEPHFQALGQTADGSLRWSGEDQAASPSVATEHVVQLVGLPGPASLSLSALVPDPATPEAYTLQNLPPVALTLRAPRPGGSCQAVCFDDRTGLQFDDDLQAPRLTLSPAFQAGLNTLHAGPHALTVTAQDQSPIASAVAGGSSGALVSQDLDPGTGLISSVFGFTYVVTCGAQTLSLAIADACGDTVTRTFDVAGQDQPPVLSLAPVTVKAGQPLSLEVLATDADGDPLTYAASGALPPGATFDAPSHTLHWTPSAEQVGSWPLAFTATDVCAIATGTADLTVALDHAPALQAVGPLTGTELQPVSFTLAASDADLPEPGDTLTFSMSDLPPGAAFSPDTLAFTWTPGHGQAGAYALHARVADASGLHDDQTIALSVAKANVAPAFAHYVDCHCAIPEGQDFLFPVSATDANGDRITYTSPDLPPGAALDPGTGLLSWTPDFTQASVYAITLVATDDDPVPLSAVAQLHLTILNVNRPPVLPAIAEQTVAELATLSFAVAGTDPDNPVTQRHPDLGDVLTWAVDGLPTGARFDPATQTVDWTPGYGTSGDYEPVFTLSDDKGAFAIRGARVHVLQTNRPPVIAPMAAQAGVEAQPLSFTVSVTDPGGQPVTCAMTGLPEGASFDAPGLRFTWPTTWGQSKSDMGPVFVTVRCCNETTRPGGVPACATQTVELDVAEVDRPPVLDAIPPATIRVTETVAFEVLGHDPDPESQLTYSATQLPPGATFDAGTRVFHWTPAYAQAGDYAVLFAVTDGELAAEQGAILHVLAPDYTRKGGGFATSGCSGAGAPAWLALLGILALRTKRRRHRLRAWILQGACDCRRLALVPGL